MQHRKDGARSTTGIPGGEARQPRSALEGVRVLDLTRMLAGPYCTALLSDIGAEIIKVETPGVGDDARHFAPRRGGESYYFMLINRGKKSVTLNLKSAEGLDLLYALAAKSDVVVENFKPGVAARLKIDYPALSEINSRLVYASISGFGQQGPLSHRPAYDIIAQAMGGIMSVNGVADGPPTRVGESIGDISAGIYTAWGILAGLLARERSGRGQYLDVAMLDSIFALLVTALTTHLCLGTVPQRIGNSHPISAPLDSFRAHDGHMIIAVANDPMFRRLAEAMGRPELADDPRFVTDELRKRNERDLKSLIESWSRELTVEQAVAILEKASVPASPILALDSVVNSEHIGFRGMLAQVEHPTAGRIRVLQEPVQFSETPRSVQGPAPLLGQHTDWVLSSILGLDELRIAELRRSGAV